MHDDPPSGVVRSLAVAATVAVVAGVGLSSFFRAPEHQAWPQARADATFASKPQHWARFPLPGQSTVLPWQHDKPAEAINRAIVPTPQAPSHH